MQTKELQQIIDQKNDQITQQIAKIQTLQNIIIKLQLQITHIKSTNQYTNQHTNHQINIEHQKIVQQNKNQSIQYINHQLESIHYSKSSKKTTFIQIEKINYKERQKNYETILELLQNERPQHYQELKDIMDQKIKPAPSQIFQLISEICDQFINDEKLKLVFEQMERYWEISYDRIIYEMVFELLYSKLIEEQDDLECKSQILQEKLRVLQDLISLEILEVPKELRIPSLLNQLQYDLRRINERFSPLSKVEVMDAVLQNISNIYKSTRKNSNVDADQIFPIWVYLVLMSNPEHLLLDIHFMQTYLQPNLLFGQYGYAIITTEAALMFLEKLDGIKLRQNQLQLRE